MAATLAIVNPRSSSGATARRWSALEPHLRARFEAAGVGPVDVVRTEAPRDAERIAREGVLSGTTRIVVCGGDGTVGEVVTGLLEADLGGEAAIGVLPLGRGCDLARTLGVPLDPIAAIDQLAAGAERVRRIDAGRVETADATREERGKIRTRFFLNETSLGVSGLVVQLVNRAGPLSQRFGGTAVFAQATLRALAAYRPERVRIHVDDREVYDGPLIQAAVSNGRFFGGGMRYAPNAALDDGLFDLVWVRGWSKSALFANLPRLYSGTHLEHGSGSAVRGRRFEFDAGPGERAVSLDSKLWLEADGEPLGTLPAAVDLVPGAVGVFGMGEDASAP